MAKNDKGQEANDQKINSNARRRMLSVGKVIPNDWGWVRVTRTRSDENTVWLQIKRLRIAEAH